MSLSAVFLGTGGSVPTVKRGLPAILIQREGEQIMFDCGEGVQRQMVKARCGFHRVTKVFITHMHGDHLLGLPGLLQTMAMLNRERKLVIFGPVGIAQFLECVRETVQFVLTFEVEVHEIEKEGIVCEENEYEVSAVWADHVIPSLAYAFAEKPRAGRFFPEKAKKLGVPEGVLWSRLQSGNDVKLADGRVVKPSQVLGVSRSGRRIVYTGDTRPFKACVKFAAGADLLVHDATLDDDLADRALEDGHSTVGQAAEAARKAKVRKLILTHISARYEEAGKLLERAKKIFRETEVAEDFMKVELPLKEE
jgi:ribonuclease Z